MNGWTSNKRCFRRKKKEKVNKAILKPHFLKSLKNNHREGTFGCRSRGHTKQNTALVILRLEVAVCC